MAAPGDGDAAHEGEGMADTMTLEEINKEVVKLVDELSTMQAKQERLRELIRQRGELEKQLLGMSAEAAPKGPGRRRANGAEPAPATAG
jgi:hypothetical protein